MRCNEPLEPVAKADVLHRLPPMVRVERQSFPLRAPTLAIRLFEQRHLTLVQAARLAAVAPVLRDLSNAGYRLSPQLISGVLSQAGE